MTVSSTDNVQVFNGDGSTSAFVVTFPFFEIEVVKIASSGAETVWTLGSQFTVMSSSGLPYGDGNTGTINVITAPTDYRPAAGEKLRVQRKTTNTQTLTLAEGDAFPAATIEDSFDRRVMVAQEQDRKISRAPKLTEADFSLVGELVMPSPQANRLLAWSASANGLVNKNPADFMVSATYDTDGDGVVDAAETAPWSGITGKPTTFAPSAHTHDDRYYTEGEVDAALATKAASAHTHAISDVTNLQTSLDGKAASAHTHTIANVTGLQTALDGKAASSHNHAISDVTGLQTALDGKSATGHLHDDRYYTETEVDTLLAGKAAATHNHDDRYYTETEIDTALSGKAAATHTHAISDVTDLQTALDGKAGTAHTHTLDNLTDVAVSSAVAGHILRHNGTEFVNVLGTDHFAQPDGFLAITSSATPVVLTAASPSLIYVTGSVAQTIRLPDVTTLTLGRTFRIINVSTQTVTVQSSGSNTIGSTQNTGIHADYICVLLTGTTAASWAQHHVGATQRTGTGQLVYGSSPTLSSPTVQNPTITFTTAGTHTAGTNAQGQGSTTSDVTIITSTPNNPSGVTIPGAAAGRRIFVANRGTNPVNLYPASGDQIDSLALNAAFSLPVGGAVELTAQNGINWYSSSTLLVGSHNHTLDSLSNVSITSLTTDQYLKWNGTAWVNASGGAGGGGATDLDGLSDVQITTPATGHVLRHNGTQFINVLGTDHFAAASHTHTASEISDSTTAGRALLTGADAAAQRTSLGLGTAALEGAGYFATAVHSHAISDVTGLQTALDGKATSSHSHAIADVTGLQTALDGKAASSHAHAIADVTGLQTALDNKLDDSQASAFGLSLLDDANAATARTTLGLGTAATATAPSGAIVGTTDAQTITNKRIQTRVSSTTSSASAVTPDVSAYDLYAWTAQAAALTINAPTGTPADGEKLLFRIEDNGTSRSISWNATYRAIGVTLPTATTAGKATYVGCIYNAADTFWDVIAVTTQA